VTSQEPENPQPADRDIPDTEVIVVSAPTPVFVDSTGRRRRRLQRLAYAFGAICVLYGGLISVSLAGGPVSSSAILPLPDLPDHEDAPVKAQPSPTPEPVVSTPPKTHLIIESLPHDVPLSPERRDVTTKPAPPAKKKSKAPTRKPSAPAPTATRAVESTSTPSPTVSATPQASATPVAPSPPAAQPTKKATTKAAPPPSPAAANDGAGSSSDGTDAGTGPDVSEASADVQLVAGDTTGATTGAEDDA
jgi:hypothetical protein